MIYLLKEKPHRAGALLFGALFSVIQAAGWHLEKHLVLNRAQIALTTVSVIVLTLTTAEIYMRLAEFIEKSREKKKQLLFAESDKKYFLTVWIIICLAFVPVFLAYYPGLFAYDVDTQIPQFFDGYTRHHNLIHTLYLHFFYFFIGEKVLHSYTAGIAAASLVQILLFSGMLSYIHLFLRRIQINRKLRIGLVVFSALTPFFSVLSVSMTKDVLFAGFVGMLAVGLYYWECDPVYYERRGSRAVYILSVTGTILFRNNGIYGVLFSFAAGIWFLVFRKKECRYFWCTLTGIAAALLLSSGMVFALSAKEGSKNEMLSIPYQQMAYVYNTRHDDLTEEEKNEIRTLMPDVEKYNPHLSDPVKATAIGAYEKKQLLRCYGTLFFQYPADYVKAFFLNNLGYLALSDTSHAEIYGAELEERSGYLLTDTKEGFGVTHTSYFQPLETLYEHLFSANEYQDYLLLRILCSPALYFWMIAALLFLAVDLRKHCLVSFAFVSGLLLTMFAGPCVLIRYALPYIVCVPALAAAVFRGNRD